MAKLDAWDNQLQPTYRLRVAPRHGMSIAQSVGLHHRVSHIEAVIDQHGEIVPVDRIWRSGISSRVYFPEPVFTGGLTILFYG